MTSRIKSLLRAAVSVLPDDPAESAALARKAVALADQMTGVGRDAPNPVDAYAARWEWFTSRDLCDELRIAGRLPRAAGDRLRAAGWTDGAVRTTHGTLRVWRREGTPQGQYTGTKVPYVAR